MKSIYKEQLDYVNKEIKSYKIEKIREPLFFSSASLCTASLVTFLTNTPASVPIALLSAGTIGYLSLGFCAKYELPKQLSNKDLNKNLKELKEEKKRLLSIKKELCNLEVKTK